jgi:hypothetical protein
MYDQVPDSPLAELTVDCTGSTPYGYLYRRSSSTTTLLCAYGAFGPLVYGLQQDDSARHCNGRSREVSAGVAPRDLRLVHYHSYRGCQGVPEHSVAPLFDELFPEERPDVRCASARDDCRGRVSMLVCSPDSQCVACASHAECRTEYPYFGDSVSCRYGACTIDRLLGSCAAESSPQACSTATETFACVDERCARAM